MRQSADAKRSAHSTATLAFAKKYMLALHARREAWLLRPIFCAMRDARWPSYFQRVILKNGL